MKLTKKKREAIENEWVDLSDRLVLSWNGDSEGFALCNFLRCEFEGVLYVRFRREVYRCCRPYIDCYFDGFSGSDHSNMSYLCRALTLNLLLNHEEDQQ